ncbi:MAG: DUF5916 domain-containing protein [Pseudohongiellaceae bacterium]
MKTTSPHTFQRALLVCLSSLILLGLVPGSAAQDQLPQLTRLEEEDANILLDGNLDEPVWQRLPVIDGMRVIDPDTLVEAPLQTHTRIFYTERGIYIGVMNFQDPDTLVARMTSRDTQLDRDGFVVGIDASGTGLYGYFLRINLGDSMTDATLLPERQMNMQWDGGWNGRTQAQVDGWSVEYFVPWSMMALPQVGDTRQIGFYLERQVGYLGGEAWSWPALPRTVNQYLSAFEKFELREIEPRRQLTFYPYASTIYDGIKQETEYKAGTEIFWRPTTNTQLSATLNPDFGNVESDDVVVNLTAFETFFPEKRSFFLEGQDIFNTSQRSSGTMMRGPGGPIQLLNTRRIGGAALYSLPAGASAVATDLSRPTDLLGAVKLVGQNGAWRYGTLLASEDDSQVTATLADGSRTHIQAEGRDFSVGRLLYEDTIGGGRRAIGWMGTDISHPDVDATVNAMDMHFFSADNRWVVDGQLMHSDVDGVTGAGGFVDIGYRPSRGIQHGLDLTYLDDTLDITDLGFLTRNDQLNVNYNFFLNQSDIPGLRNRSTMLFLTNQFNTDGQPVQVRWAVGRNYTTMANNSFNLGLQYYPPRIDDRLGRGTGDFRTGDRWGGEFRYNSNPSLPIAYNLDIRAAQEELGTKNLTTSGGVSWRPNDRFSFDLDLSYTDRESLLVHRGAGRYTSFEAHQWAPRLESSYFITAKQQLRISMQWTALKAFEDRFWQVNTSKRENLIPVAKPNTTPDDFIISRMTFQLRYRWEIAPLSDLFVVYTRGSNLPGNSFDEFPDLLEQSWNEKIVDTFAVKLRYRFGS